MKNKALWLFVSCCGLPLFAAYIALHSGWFPSGTTNYGRFVEGELHIDELKHRDGKLWTILLNSPETCQQACATQKASLEALFVALGKLQKDVDIAILGKEDKTLPFANIDNSLQLSPANLYLVDNKGLVVLQYPFDEDPETNRLVQKGLLSDLKKLLNYARSS